MNKSLEGSCGTRVLHFLQETFCCLSPDSSEMNTAPSRPEHNFKVVFTNVRVSCYDTDETSYNMFRVKSQ